MKRSLDPHTQFKPLRCDRFPCQSLRTQDLRLRFIYQVAHLVEEGVEHELCNSQATEEQVL